MAPRSAIHETDPRWTAVEDYTSTHLFNPTRNKHHGVLEYAYRNSLEKGLPDIAVDPSQGKYLSLQVQLTGAKNILEVGTLGGYSTIWLAIGAGKNGKVTSVEVDPHHKNVAEENIAHAGFDDQVDVLLGKGTDILPQLVEDVKSGRREPFDFVFIDADKENNLAYYESALQMIRPKTCVYVDNVVRSGRIIDEQAIREDSRVIGARQLIEAVGKDDRVDAVVLQTVGSKNYDGFLLAVLK
ncbi:hypothetical protein PV08_00482 [Exophiala spinifera]|uniref:O-methyltransferase n=1 Tax=Exophiala spinifera TaxID=91928 RepID=A0A0D2A527_9EURO|nr:uncharacterized protein PV08_00482 [Exophiala spinifera]KIW19907.1 hypothetical protein PV08_00482 [Exophiala spinifera]